MKIGRLEIEWPKLRWRKINIQKQLCLLDERIDRQGILAIRLQNENEVRFQKIEAALKVTSDIIKKLTDGNK